MLSARVSGRSSARTWTASLLSAALAVLDGFGLDAWIRREVGDDLGGQAALEELLDIAQQLHGAEKAIAQAKRTLIQNHLDHCLDDVVGPLVKDDRRSIDEFKEITKYL